MEATNTTEQINGQDPATGAAEEVEEQIPLIALTIVTPTKDELKLSVRYVIHSHRISVFYSVSFLLVQFALVEAHGIGFFVGLAIRTFFC